MSDKLVTVHLSFKFRVSLLCLVTFQMQCTTQSYLHTAEMIVFESIRKHFMINNVNVTKLNIVGNTVEQNGLPKSHRMPFCPEIKTENRRC